MPIPMNRPTLPQVTSPLQHRTGNPMGALALARPIPPKPVLDPSSIAKDAVGGALAGMTLMDMMRKKKEADAARIGLPEMRQDPGIGNQNVAGSAVDLTRVDQPQPQQKSTWDQFMSFFGGLMGGGTGSVGSGTGSGVTGGTALMQPLM